ncbi:MAG: gamma-glutamyl hercynylcysteine S-oxide synthase, partial [Acidimicrobiaceae bacterium]|nr:gamma-glutamyl hercynylcysteine S-oxide synthase [Acidimicrobiaceae bacterium]
SRREPGETKLAKEQPTEIAKQMKETRARTLALFRLAREEDLHESPGFGFRPIIWHLAHIGVFEAYWLLQKLKNEKAPDERYERIFDPINTPREQSKNLPTLREMEDYLTRVRERVLEYLEETQFDESDPHLRDGYLFRLVLEHEQQHQETLAYLFQLLNPSKKMPPASIKSPDRLKPVVAASEMASVAEGLFVMGATEDAFAYDNERPLHTVHVPAFKIDRLLTTNEEYARFINEGGYRRREWWSDEGWDWREREDWNAPLYWTQQNGDWRVQRMFDESLMDGQHPVVGVSWYEAEAYARFMNKRLPTEAEWEKAASWDSEREQKRRFSWGDREPSLALCNFNYHFWGTTPVGIFSDGASATGCLDMTGNVWEWTSSAFMGYPSFRPFPYPEYSQEWFDGDHRVLKGGSWATQASTLRISFRNFFRRHFRIAFAGIRCAG